MSIIQYNQKMKLTIKMLWRHMQMMSPMDPSYLGQGGLLTPELVSRDKDNLYLMQLNL